MGNYSEFSSNENEVIICCREYSRCVRDTKNKLEEYFDEAEKFLEEFVMSADFLKDLSENQKDNLTDFLLDCNFLAQEMAASLIVVYQKNHSRICASVVCDKIVFKHPEIEVLMKLCAFATEMEFFSSPVQDIPGSVINFHFDISGKSLNLIGLIDLFKDYI